MSPLYWTLPINYFDSERNIDQKFPRQLVKVGNRPVQPLKFLRSVEELQVWVSGLPI